MTIHHLLTIANWHLKQNIFTQKLFDLLDILLGGVGQFFELAAVDDGCLPACHGNILNLRMKVVRKVQNTICYFLQTNTQFCQAL